MRHRLVQALLLHGRTADPLPSAQSLTRYIGAFSEGFHERYPLFRTHTAPLTNLPADLAFVLLAIGADSCLETKAALYLFESAVAISPALLGKWQNDLKTVFPSHDMHSTAVTTRGLSDGENSWLDEPSHVLCLMTLLTAFALQNRSPAAMRVMWSVQGVLAHDLRQSLSMCHAQEELTPNQPGAWPEWVRLESQRRVKHAAFCILSLVSLTFDFPAAVPFGQLRIAVPCSAEEWSAASPEEWQRVRESIHPKSFLLSNLVESMLAGGESIATPSSRLGDFTILHAILQRIQAIHQVLPIIPQDIQTNMEYVVILEFLYSLLVAPTVVSSRLCNILTEK